MLSVYSLWRLRRRCSQLAGICRIDLLCDYLEGCEQLNPGQIDNTPMIAVDLELTGLDTKKNKIISIGWTLIDNGRIRLGSNQHLLVSTDHSVGDSATIHELLDNELETGISIEDALGLLFQAAKGRVWVFHHAGLDVAFLQVACRQWAELGASTRIPMMTLDTLQIELSTRQRRDIPVKPGDLQLGELRAHYHLPDYKGHNALVDALATAELMLAMAARLDRDESLHLKPYLKFI
ncbi:MAG: 3'-5' exonuclease [Proteobacteria bacterium]|nr:3'-5' exonuclease [Pseudomonadota bacterium]